jgi:prepilin-type N-terminal cleavage/methylation domain-containing protein
MLRFPSRQAFTLIEMITVIAVIAILSGLVLSIAGLVQNKGTRAKTEGEINALKAACESYKTDNGGYPQDIPAADGGPSATNDLNARVHGNPSTADAARYAAASLFLYKQLTGDENANGKIDMAETGRKYATDFFKPARFNSSFKTTGTVTYISDSFGYSFGYSTAGLKVEQDYRVLLETTPSAPRPATLAGYNPTFDVWSTAGTTTGSESDKAKWIKNW